MLPNLSDLNLENVQRKPRRELSGPKQPEDGVYCLDKQDSTDPCNSYVILKRQAIMASEDEFNEAETFFLDNLHPFKFMNTLVTRRQCTFGKVQYARYKLMSDENKWPSLVHRVIQATQAFAAELGIANPEEYNAVHGNYYEDEGAGVAAHSDDEKQLVQKAPIFSYTFLKNDNNEFAREFVIKRKPGALHETIDKTTGGVKIILESGDLLVMGGDMQEHFTHELPKLKIVDENKYVPRINFTVRRFTEADPKKRGREY